MADVDDVQVLGLCRFSYPANLSAFQTRHEDMETRKAALYAPARLEQRCFMFEQFLLPALKAQTDKNYTLMLLMGDDFPEPYRSRMLAHCEACPQIKPIFRPTAPHREVYRELFLEHRDPEARVVAEFRLDDDDAVAIDFVARLRKVFPKIRALFGPKGRALVDFTRGLVVQPREVDMKYIPVIANFWSPGLAMYSRPGAPNCVMDFGRHKAFQFMPTVCLSNDVMFLRGDHDTNDSNIGLRTTLRFKMPEDGPAGILQRRFAIDAEQVEAAWQDLQKPE